MRRIATIAAVAALALASSGCGSDGPSRPEVLGALVDDSIVPVYERLEVDTGALADAATQLCDDLDDPDRLEVARAALAAARSTWSHSEAMWVGPVMERRSWAVIDWPIAPDEIEELIADESIVLDLDRLSRRIGADQRGLGAVEYVLGDEAPPLDERRCEYLTGITQVIVGEAELIPSDWTESWEDGEPYRAIFVDPESSGLDAIVNDALFLTEAMADGELGVALGAMDGPADPEAILEGPQGLAAADLAAHLDGLRDVLLGATGDGGLGPLLGGELRDTLTVQLDEADAAVAALDSPLRDQVVTDPDPVAAAREAIKAIQVTIATEVVSRLGVTVGFSDADGDTG